MILLQVFEGRERLRGPRFFCGRPKERGKTSSVASWSGAQLLIRYDLGQYFRPPVVDVISFDNLF